jgi:hypothetical protein
MIRQLLWSAIAPRGGKFAPVLGAFFLIAQANPSRVSIQPNLAKGPGITVEAREVIPYNGPSNPLYKISYVYKFEGRNTVFIDGGPGVVPAEGQFSYLSRTLELKFFDSPNGALIVDLPLQVTLVPAGDATEDAPNEADFPAVGKEGDWSRSSPEFKVHIDKVLNSLDLSYRFCSTQDQCLITGYRVVDFPAQHGEKGKVAVKIAYADRGGKAHFRINAKVQEKLSRGSWLAPDDQAVVEAADKFVTLLLEQLER